MSKTAAITAHLTPETLALVDQVAKAQGRSRASFAEEAIRRVAEREAEHLAFLQAGIDAANRGELVGQEDMEAWFASRMGARTLDKDPEFLAFVQEGIDAADRGELIPHADVEAELAEMIARHKAR